MILTRARRTGPSRMMGAFKGQVSSGLIVILILWIAPAVVRSEGIDFACEAGWTLLSGGYTCYKAIPDAVHYKDAKQQCGIIGGDLAAPHNRIENNFIGALAVQAKVDPYWLNEDGRHMYYWAPGEPKTASSPLFPSGSMVDNYIYQYSVSLVAGGEARGMACERPACLADQVPCIDGTCQTGERCDGTAQCLDESDEMDCPNLCRYLVTGASGTIETAHPYEANTNCRWTIAVAPGMRIKLEFSALETERQRDVVVVWSGGLAVGQSTITAGFSGRDLPDLPTYSDNNYMIVIFTADNAEQKGGFTAAWTAEEDEGGVGVIGLAEQGELLSPFYPDMLLALMRTAWLITLPPRQIATVKVIEMSWGDDLDAELKALDGGVHTGPELVVYSRGGDNPPYVQSVSNKMLLSLETVAAVPGAMFKLQYYPGCDVEVTSDTGAVISPGYDAGVPYPAFLSCSYVVTALEGSALKLIIEDGIDLENNQDIMEILKKNGDIWEAVVTVTGQTKPDPNTLILEDGAFKVTLDTSPLRSGGGFKVTYGKACPDPEFSDETIADPVDWGRGLRDSVTVTCPEGFIFQQEEYLKASNVTLSCTNKGWDKSQLPSCKPIYCGNPPDVEGGYMSNTTGVEYDDTATYLCPTEDVGGKPGEIVIKCLVTGVWEQPRSCNVMSCNEFNVTDGTVLIEVGTGTSHGTVVSVSCSDGLRIDGAPKLLCERSSWSSALPTCTSIMCPVIQPVNAQATSTQGTVNDAINVTCNEGYAVESSAEIVTLQSVVCQTDGIYDKAIEPCVDINECDGLTGTNECSDLATCVNTEALYDCVCPEEDKKCSGWVAQWVDSEIKGVLTELPLRLIKAVASLANCQELCRKDLGCKSLVFVLGTNECMLYDKDSLKDPGEKIELVDAAGNTFSEITRAPSVCMAANGHCDGTCDPEKPDALCSCDGTAGLLLWTDAGVGGVQPATGEAGDKPGDVRYKGHACVVQQCAVPTIENEILVTTLEEYKVGDKVFFMCNLGYQMTGTDTLTCEVDEGKSEGKWNGDSPTCAVATCEIPTLSEDFPPELMVVGQATLPATLNYGETIQIKCTRKRPSDTPLTFTRECVYDQANQKYSIVMDDLLSCPVIDCGEPVVPPIATAVTQPEDIYFEAIFSAQCRPGMEIDGDDAQVEIACETDSNWNFEGLKCRVPLCDDPGSPKDGSYDLEDGGFNMGHRVSYTCTRSGYQPDGSAEVSAACTTVPPSLVPTFNIGPPTCKDMEKPAFTDCPMDTYIIDKLRAPQFSIPGASDNTNVKEISVDPVEFDPNRVVPGDPRTFTVTYTATDFEGLTDTCVVTVRIKNDVPPEITCPASYTVYIADAKKPTSITPGDAGHGATGTDDVEATVAITYSSEEYDVSAADIASVKVVTATASDTDGNQASCQYTISVEAAPCQPWALARPLDGQKSCRVEGGLTLCDMTCDQQAGYPGFFNPTGRVFIDTMMYQCTAGGDWMYDGAKIDQVLPCVAPVPTVYSFGLQFQYQAVSGSLAGKVDTCKTVYDASFAAIKTELMASLGPPCAAVDPSGQFGSFEIELVELSDRWTYDSTKDTIQYKTRVDVGPAEFDALQWLFTCATVLSLTAKLGYELASTSIWQVQTTISGDGGDCPDITFVTTDPGSVKDPDPGFNCPEQQRLYVFGTKTSDRFCMPCPAGTHHNPDQVDECVACPLGTYQAESTADAVTSCVACDADMSTVFTGAVSKDQCRATCAVLHMTSTATILPPCEECPKGTYLNNLQCDACPDGTDTKGRGAKSQDECIAHCEAGTYSIDGILPCKNCPSGFYQKEKGQKTCQPCYDGTSEKPQHRSCLADTVVRLLQLEDEAISSSGHPLDTQTDIADVDACKQVCTANIDCLSLNYVSSSQTCTLFDVDSRSGTVGAHAGTTHSEVILDEACKGASCANEGACKIDNSETWCQCAEGYSGATCDTKQDACLSKPCYHDGACTEENGVYKCTCVNDYAGDQCETPKDHCDGVVCQNMGKCRNLGTSYACVCADNYAGTHCETKTTESKACESITCNAHGTCVTVGDSMYKCQCDDGWRGAMCTNDNDECASSPCMYSGACIDGDNGFTCECPTGFTGDRCQVRPDVCATTPCGDSGSCLDNYRANGHYCTCNAGYGSKFGSDDQNSLANFLTSAGTGGTAMQCDQLDMCAASPCANSGTCMKEVNDYTCICEAGFQGKNCQHNIDECATTECQNDGTCVDGVNSFTCDCAPGFEGVLCDTAIDFCAPDPCDTAGTSDSGCTSAPTGSTCPCKEGYRGKTCEINIQECDVKPCRNGAAAQCDDGVNDYTCVCPEGWTGTHCDEMVETCQADSCKNGGICHNTFNGFYCECVGNFYGKDCGFGNSRCADASPCVSAGSSCVAQEDGKLPKCICEKEQMGAGCQIARNLCKGREVCAWGKCTQDAGTMNCECYKTLPKKDYDGILDFEGPYCDQSKDDCEGVTCEGGGVCVDGISTYFCQCPVGKGGEKCERDLDVDHDVFFNPAVPRGMVTGNPFPLNTASFSLSCWVRYAEKGAQGVIMALFGMNSVWAIMPRTQMLLIGAQQMTVNFGGAPRVLIYQDQSGASFAANIGNWINVVVAYDAPANKLQIYLNTVLVGTLQDVVTNTEDIFKYGLLNVGSYRNIQGKDIGLKGYISRVYMWGRAISWDEVSQVYTQDVPQDGLIHIWDGTADVRNIIIRPSTVGVAIGTAPGKPVTFAKPVNDILVTSKDRVTAVTWDPPAVEGSTEQPISIFSPGNTFLWGVYYNAYVVKDDAGNYATNRFRIYVRPEDCENPITPTTNANSTCATAPQDNSIAEKTKMCSANCAPGKDISVLHPKQYTCDGLGTFNPNNHLLQHFHSKEEVQDFVLPQCSAATKAALEFVFDVTYSNIQNCEATKSVGGVQKTIIMNVEKLNWKWDRTKNAGTGGAFCPSMNCVTDTVITFTCPSEARRRRRRKRAAEPAKLNMVLKNVADPVFNKDTGEEASPLDILTQETFKSEGLMDADNVLTSGDADRDTLNINIDADCPEGQVLRGVSCVECAPGTYHAAAQAACLPCPRGEVAAAPSSTACTPCPPNNTTPLTGAIALDQCRPVCGAGEYYSQLANACVECALGFFQPNQGEFYCEPCNADKTTHDVGANTADLCFAVCANDGEELRADGACHKCDRGTYRGATKDKGCEPCRSGFITADVGTTSEAGCDIPACAPGWFLLPDKSACDKCPVGEYQPAEWQTACLQCSDGFITVDTGTATETDCKQFCEDGKELNGESACVDCAVRFYRSNAVEGLFSQCVACLVNTTNGPGKALAADCIVDIDECAEKVDICDKDNGVCINDVNGYSCDCKPGYSLDVLTNVCSEINECLAAVPPCHADAICNDTDGAHTCECKPGYTGDGVSCADIDECTDEPDICKAVNGICGNEPGSYDCSCDPGYEWKDDEKMCVDIDECLTRTCALGSECKNTPGSSECVCSAGFIDNNDGKGCVDIDECAENTANCHEDAVCINTVGGIDCLCKMGYRGNGTSCQDVDECTEGGHTCTANSGVCSNTKGSYECRCAKGFEGNGTLCTHICDVVPPQCLNDGVCDRATKKCKCSPYYGGEHCETRITPARNSDLLVGAVIGGVVGLLLLILIIVGICWCCRPSEGKKTTTTYSNTGPGEPVIQSPYSTLDFPAYDNILRSAKASQRPVLVLQNDYPPRTQSAFGTATHLSSIYAPSYVGGGTVGLAPSLYGHEYIPVPMLNYGSHGHSSHLPSLFTPSTIVLGSDGAFGFMRPSTANNTITSNFVHLKEVGRGRAGHPSSSHHNGSTINARSILFLDDEGDGSSYENSVNSFVMFQEQHNVDDDEVGCEEPVYSTITRT